MAYPKPVVLGSLSTVQPSPHQQFNAGSLRAITVFNADTDEFTTVNSPIRVFFPNNGGLTVQGPRGSRSTVKAGPGSFVVAKIH